MKVALEGQPLLVPPRLQERIVPRVSLESPVELEYKELQGKRGSRG
jgi:hypothetical protein